LSTSVSLTTLAFFAAIASGFLHAVWNALAKRSGDPAGAMIAQLITAGLFAFVTCLFIGWPEAHVWHWMLMGALGNTAAVVLLAMGYQRGDYAITYGLSRATVPWMLTPLTVLVLGSTLRATDLIGIAAISLGVPLAATNGARPGTETRQASVFAVASGICVAFAIFADSRGAVLAGALHYGVAQTALNAAVGGVVYRVQSGKPLVDTLRRHGRVGAATAIVSTTSYLLILWVFTQLPPVVGAALRDSSLLFALLIGILYFGERLQRMQWLGCACLIGGVAMLRL
jgi:drug/metabolite transporter (DMT)-like permease